jgi:beta-lactamase class A
MSHKATGGSVKFQLLICCVVFVCGAGIGIFARPLLFGVAVQNATPSIGEVRQQDQKQTSFINPLLECRELSESFSIGDRKKLEEEMERLIQSRVADGTISVAALYFRDLNNGPWFGINETLKFYPASLIKVPLAMHYYSKAERDPGILTQEIDFAGPRGVSIVHFAPPEALEEKKIYTIEELISKMLRFSDNDAAHILQEFAGKETESVYSDLGVSAGTPGAEYSIDVRTYASFFRILFNATYLTRSLSEQMLKTLSESSFDKGIVAGVPSSVKVSHKFGEKIVSADGPLLQLHDCGIVYLPGQPYSLCIMTQGSDFDKLAEFIAEASSNIYEEISKQ